MDTIDLLRQHEASHAICADLLSMPVRRIAIDAKGGEVLYRISGDRDDLREATSRLVVALAGVAAQEIATLGYGEWPDGDDDGAQAMTLARRCARIRGRTDPRAAHEIHAEAAARAHELVALHWDAVLTLARSLEISGDRIEGDDCGHALRAALRGEVWQRPRPPVPEPFVTAFLPDPPPDDDDPANWEARHVAAVEWLFAAGARLPLFGIGAPRPVRRVASTSQMIRTLDRQNTWRDRMQALRWALR